MAEQRKRNSGAVRVATRGKSTMRNGISVPPLADPTHWIDVPAFDRFEKGKLCGFAFSGRGGMAAWMVVRKLRRRPRSLDARAVSADCVSPHRGQRETESL